MKLAAVLMLMLMLMLMSACASTSDKVLTGLEISCQDPAARERLGVGATYRDLAMSRAEAIEGWTVCHDALDVAQAY
jgi:hypothetical protein